MHLRARSSPLLSVLFSLLLCGDRVLGVTKEYTDAQKKAILDAHNKYRRDVAKTHGASNMRLMEWNSDLEDYIWNFLKTQTGTQTTSCTPAHSSKADRASQAKTGFQGAVGENIWWQWWSNGVPENLNWTIVAESWYSEVKWWNYAPIEQDCKAPEEDSCGHFTQMVWADSFLLGCAGIKCADGKSYLAGCVYGPSGNWRNEYPFKQGTPCTGTKEKTAIHVVDHLCSTQKQVDTTAGDDDVQNDVNGEDVDVQVTPAGGDDVEAINDADDKSNDVDTKDDNGDDVETKGNTTGDAGVTKGDKDGDSDLASGNDSILGPNLTVMLLLYMCLYVIVVVLE